MIWIVAAVVVLVGVLLFVRRRNKRKSEKTQPLIEIKGRWSDVKIPFTPVKKHKPQLWDVKSKKPWRKFPLHQQMKRRGANIGGIERKTP